MAQAQRRSITRHPPVAASIPNAAARQAVIGRKVSRARNSSCNTPCKARFPRLRQIRTEQLGWDVTEIAARRPGHRPSAPRSIGWSGATPLPSPARRVFDVINAALNNALNPGKELQLA